MSNVQLSSRESVVVYRDPETKRILGFGPEYAKPAFPAGTKYTSETCLHASDVERRMMEYREQCLRDAEASTLRKLERERPIRDSIRSAVLARNSEVDPWNRDVNNALLRTWDHFYQRACNARLKAEVCTVAEKYDASKTTEQIANESRYIQRGDFSNG
jgi:hypothetical protein